MWRLAPDEDLRACAEVARCAAQLLAWSTADPNDRMLAEAVTQTLDQLIQRLKR